MTNDMDTQLQSIDSAMLTQLVQQVLGSEAVEVIDWDCELVHESGWHANLYRLSGKAHDQDRRTPWSLILKTIPPMPNRDNPSGAIYWKREVLTYQSGLLDDLPGGLAAPQCYGIAEHSGEEFWLWLEDLSDDIGPKWPLEHYGVVARHLGQFNGAYLMGQPLPSWPWLGRHWMRSYVAPRADGMAQLPDYLEHPLVRRAIPGDVARVILKLWAERDFLFDALDRLPQTFCHRDAWKRNLFARRGPDSSDQTVAIDWDRPGIGAIGEEIVPLVSASLIYSEIPMDKARELDTIAFDGYLQGLRETGWKGNERAVRLGYAITSVMRYGFFAGWWINMARDESFRAHWERIRGPAEEQADADCAYNHFLLTLATEACELLDEL